MAKNWKMSDFPNFNADKHETTATGKPRISGGKLVLKNNDNDAVAVQKIGGISYRFVRGIPRAI